MNIFEIKYYEDGYCYFLNDGIHRESQDGVADFYDEFNDNNYYQYKEAYFFKGYFHNVNGPAFLKEDDTPQWYYFGDQIDCSSQEEFDRMIKLIAFW